MTTQNPSTFSTPVPEPDAGFAGDAGVGNLRQAARAYLGRLRGGETGALPAVLGVIVMLVIFSRASPVFLRVGNLANLPAQGAAIALIAMGLVFVLLLGEIDLSAGTGSGVSAALMAIALIHSGDVHKALATPTFVGVVTMFVVAAGLAVGPVCGSRRSRSPSVPFCSSPTRRRARCSPSTSVRRPASR